MLLDAIRQGDAARVQSLISADPALAGTRTAEGATLVQWAVYTQHAELAPLLLGTRQPDFFESCALGRTARAIELLDADPALANAHSSDGFTGLGLACFFRHPEIAALLLDRGADPNLAASNALRVAPLHSAIAAGMSGLVRRLLDRGADPSIREAGGLTPLHTAAATANREVIELLLSAGVSRSARANDGKTPADMARQYKHPEIAEMLESAPC
jgi:ankyrin repeat protein